ncbi:MAG: prepilin-type N-terminal cleavage/methylation domain-containing protein [Terriglobales bacterium]
MKRNRQRGFSMLEIVVVIAIVMIVMAVVFGQMWLFQKTARREQTKIDLTQESRAFLDQIVRDLHQAGYPNGSMYGSGVLNATPQNDSRYASGLVKFSYTDLWFEGDVDDDGQVESVRYTLQADANGNCPCTIARSVVVKLNNTAPMSQATNYSTSLENVVNSAGSGGTGTNGSLTITGNSMVRNASGSMVSTSNDSLYSAYEGAYLFVAYDASGNTVSPTDIATNPTALASIRTIQITLNVLASSSAYDLQNNYRPAVSMTAAARLYN